jgi:hypothetical protein
MGNRGHFIFRRFKVRSANPEEHEKVGQCFKETMWGRGNVRWVWLRFEDGSEKAFAPSHLTPAGVKR